jgi:hypothetical protein
VILPQFLLITGRARLAALPREQCDHEARDSSTQSIDLRELNRRPQPIPRLRVGGLPRRVHELPRGVSSRL